jgi:hypothetical protein
MFPKSSIHAAVVEIARTTCGHLSLHAQRLKHRIARIGVEAGLELGEELPWYGRDVADAGHRQEQALGTSICGDLEGLCKILHGHDVAAESQVI